MLVIDNLSFSPSGKGLKSCVVARKVRVNGCIIEKCMRESLMTKHYFIKPCSVCENMLWPYWLQ